ncbi:hypothetical protein E2C01_003249 [Portunus trituberculatus]|uniref:Uncharacterized protein n=1 Tax=Portunus trituberculatus TaxID=210409 RepID=A0A5B7CLP8_PORTR|nr:hypothetical protein [Portunus trituberculatus]
MFWELPWVVGRCVQPLDVRASSSPRAARPSDIRASGDSQSTKGAESEAGAPKIWVNNTKRFHETILLGIATAPRPRVSHPHAGSAAGRHLTLPLLRVALPTPPLLAVNGETRREKGR